MSESKFTSELPSANPRIFVRFVHEYIGEDHKIEQLMGEQYLPKILRKFLLGQSEKQQIEFDNNIPKIKNVAYNLTKIINAYAMKENLRYFETLFVIDCLYRTAAWEVYKKLGNCIVISNQEFRNDGYV